MTAFNWDLPIPWGYGTSYKTLREAEATLKPNYHPEYLRRLLAWLHYKDGHVGIGGHFRPDGTQPDKPGFAPEGTSFHQNQKYSDGFIGACAVDTVIVDGPDAGDAHDGIPWSEVPIQGSAEAARWGIHANVGVPGSGESWHIQPVEIDGHASWLKAGSPAPVKNYPLPAEHNPHPEEVPVTPFYFTLKPLPAPLYVVEDGKDGRFAVYVDTAEWVRRGNPMPVQISPSAGRKYIFAYPVPEGVVV